MKQRISKTTLIIGGAVIAILLAATGVLGWKYYQVSKTDKNQTNQAKETSNRIIDKVSSLYMVPTDEDPTVAQIQDKSKLDNQEFFEKANNGDYLLIYQKNKIALVYREKDDKLVNVGPVSIDANSGETAGAQTGPDVKDPADSKAP